MLFSINARQPQIPDSYTVSLSWRRPPENSESDEVCGAEIGSRTIGFDRPVVLPVGKPVTLEADGGVVVTLTRR